MRRSKRLFDESLLILLLIVCSGLVFILFRTVMETDDGNKDLLKASASSVQISEAAEGDTAGDENAAEQDQLIPELAMPVLQKNTAQIWQEDMGQTDAPPTVPVFQEALTGIVSPEVYEFTISDKTYFDDALFIGDSRTVGLREFGTLDNADYFATPGLNLYTIENTKMKLSEEEQITLEEMLEQKTYGKIYLMTGINELGYDFDTTVKKYEAFLEYLRTVQPDAIVYVCANLHVNGLRDELDEIHNNAAINRMNEVIETFADQKDIFYLDVNPLFDDEKGNLSDEYISDDSHLLGKYYEVWCDWYCENTIVKTAEE